MSRLSRGFQPYAQEVADLYRAMDAGDAPASLNPVGHGSDSYVFESHVDSNSLIKLPVFETNSMNHARRKVRKSVAALALGYQHPRLEQLIGFNDKSLPSLVVKKVGGVSLEAASITEVLAITRGHLEGVVDTFDYMHANGLTIEGEVWRDVILQTDGISFIDYVQERSYSYHQKLVDFGWMLSRLPNAPATISRELALTFHDVCAERLTPTVIMPLTNILRDEAGLPV